MTRIRNIKKYLDSLKRDRSASADAEKSNRAADQVPTAVQAAPQAVNKDEESEEDGMESDSQWNGAMELTENAGEESSQDDDQDYEDNPHDLTYEEDDGGASAGGSDDDDDDDDDDDENGSHDGDGKQQTRLPMRLLLTFF